MRDGNLKDRLCEVDGDGRMLHVGSSLPWPSMRPIHRWHHDAARQEESIPSHAPDGAGDFGNAPLVMRFVRHLRPYEEPCTSQHPSWLRTERSSWPSCSSSTSPPSCRIPMPEGS